MDETKKEPTTALAVSPQALRCRHAGTPAYDDVEMLLQHIALLERRMGAMAAVLGCLEAFLRGPTTHYLPRLEDVRAAITDAPPVFTPSVPGELAMLIDSFAAEVQTAEEYATRPKGGQQVTPTGDFLRCTPSMLARLRWWANALTAGRTAVAVFTLEALEEAMANANIDPEQRQMMRNNLRP